MSYDNSEPPIKQPWYKRIGDINPVFAMMFMILALTIGVIFAYSKSQTEVKVEAKVEAKELGPKEDELTLDDAYAALFRHLKADQICYVEESNGYFIHFDKEVTKDDVWAGWFYVKSPTFYRNKSNNTWFLFNTPDEGYTRVWPNVEDMNCGDANDYEGK